MFCPKCETELIDEKKRCSNCGWTLEEDSALNTNNTSAKPLQSFRSDVLESSSVAKPKSNPLKLIIIVAAIIAIVVIIGVIAHYNSDDYKIKKASELIVQGNYTEGINEIRDIYTPQATTIKAFMNVEMALQTFINSANSGDFEEHKSAYYDFVAKLDLFEQENETFYLPDILYKNYEFYRAALKLSNDYTDDELYDLFRDVQMVTLNMIDFETGKTFTLKDIQNRIDTSTKALNTLKAYNFTYVEINEININPLCHMSLLDTDSGYKTIVYLNEALSGIISSMSYYCKLEIESSKEIIEAAPSDWDPEDKLSNKKPDSGYYIFVGSDLDKIFSVDSIHINANKLTHMVQLDIFYYLLVGATSSAY